MPEAIPVFDDAYAIPIANDKSGPNDQRFVTLGAAKSIRIISARLAEPHEHDEHEAEP